MKTFTALLVASVLTLVGPVALGGSCNCCPVGCDCDTCNCSCCK
ncbi:MAG: hypothetical protein AAGI68_05075 [Planctomycetota bacterium]